MEMAWFAAQDSLAMPNRFSAHASVSGIAAPMADGTPEAIATGKLLFRNNCAIYHKASGVAGIHFSKIASANLQSPHLETVYHNKDSLIAPAIPRSVQNPVFYCRYDR
jgi:hypothetical protein